MARGTTPPASPEALSARTGLQPAGVGPHRWLVDESETHHAVSVTVQGELDEIDAEFLERFGARVESVDVSSHAGDDTGLINLVFTRRSTDLWTTLLTTMHAAWTAGFKPVGVTARVLEPSSSPP